MMQNPLSRFILLVKYWFWLIVLGVLLCGGASYIISKLSPPVYQASATFILTLGSSQSAYDNFTASVAAVPTYAQLLQSPAVLAPVAARYQGMTIEQLNAMITVKPQANTQLIELDVQNHDPKLALALTNALSQSFVQFANTQMPGNIQVLPAAKPGNPIKPTPLIDAAYGALVGLGLALALIIIFEWLGDRLASPEEVQKLLGVEVLMAIPHLSRRQRKAKLEDLPEVADDMRVLCSRLSAAQVSQHFKLIMVSSALGGEGKSTVAATLAILLAQAGKRVLLIDVNLRCPTLNQRFQLDNQYGFTSVFENALMQPEVERFLQKTSIPNLRVLTTGVPPANVMDLLQSSQASQLFEHLKQAPCDYIICDAPPLLAVADTQFLLPRMHALLLVADSLKTPRRALVRAAQMLEKSQTAVLGVIINNSPWQDERKSRRYIQHKPLTKTSVGFVENGAVAPEQFSWNRSGVSPLATMPSRPQALSPETMGRSPHLLSYSTDKRDQPGWNSGDVPRRSIK